MCNQQCKISSGILQTEFSLTTVHTCTVRGRALFFTNYWLKWWDIYCVQALVLRGAVGGIWLSVLRRRTIGAPSSEWIIHFQYWWNYNQWAIQRYSKYMIHLNNAKEVKKWREGIIKSRAYEKPIIQSVNPPPQHNL